MPLNLRLFKTYCKKLGSAVDAFLSTLSVRNVATCLIICSLLMVILSTAIGPNPHLKVYVLSSKTTYDEISKILSQNSNIEVLTPEQELNEFPTLTRLGCVLVVIIADYPSLAEAYPAQTGFILEGLAYATHIVVIKEYEGNSLASVVLLTFSKVHKGSAWESLPIERLSVVKLDDLSSHMSSILNVYWQYRGLKNPINYGSDYAIYILGVRVIAVFSLVLLLLQTSLASLFALTRKTMLDLFELILVSAATFVYSQVVFMVCSATIGMPLGLHYTAHGVTALSYLGNFSETYMRILFCLLGFIIGVVTFFKGALKPSRSQLAFMASLGFFIIIGFSLFYANEPFQRMMTQIIYWLSPHVERLTKLYFFPAVNPMVSWAVFGVSSFYTSRGVAVYFAGVIATAMLRRVQKFSRLTLFFVCMILIGWGGQRVGNLLPYQTYASLIPGILLGLVLVGVFLLMNAFEEKLRKDFLKQKQSRQH